MSTEVVLIEAKWLHDPRAAKIMATLTKHPNVFIVGHAGRNYPMKQWLWAEKAVGQTIKTCAQAAGIRL